MSAIFAPIEKLRIEFFAPEFFTTPPKAIKPIDEGTGRIYLTYHDRVVAVATKE